MDIKMARNFFQWCTVIDFGLLIVGVLIITLGHDWVYRLSGQLFHLTIEQFDAINYAWVVLFKTGIILFNLVPYIALRIVR